MKPDYQKEDIVSALRASGVHRGDVLFVHVSLGRLGMPPVAKMEEASALMIGALEEAIGADGTLLVPTYTYSIGKGEVFDVDKSPSTIGPLTEYFRRLPGAIRSADPMLAVSGRGPRAKELLTGLPHTCYGPGSIYERLRRLNAKICTIGLDLHWATFRHHIEELAGVPFRFRKMFHGTVVEGGETRRELWIYSAAPRLPNCRPNGQPLAKLVQAAGVATIAPLGRGQLCTVDAAAYFDYAVDAFRRDPWLAAEGPPLTREELMAAEDARVGVLPPAVPVEPGASMMELMRALWMFPRDIVSTGYDAALEALSAQLPMTVHTYPTGTACWTWFIPEKWTCREAWLETMDGRRLFAYSDHPLHVVSYSLPFEGEVNRATLFEHLHVHAKRPDALPFVFKYYERDWGLCCTQRQRDQLTDEHYRVVIRTESSYGALKVGEAVVRGQREDSFVLCAHLCHPAMANDDLSGVVVGLEVMRRLQRRKNLRYTYRLLLLPETIGSIAWLSHNTRLRPMLRGGLFLEMLGLSNPHALQLSYHGATEFDRCIRQIIKESDPLSWVGEFRKVIGNDERQFNAPGVRIPMLSLSRVLPRDNPGWPYPEYHSSDDNIALVNEKSLEESVELVIKIIDGIEADLVPSNLYQGEVFCSRYGFAQSFVEPEDFRSFLDVMYLIDGRHSISEIAEKASISRSAVDRYVRVMSQNGLVELRESKD